MPKSYRRVINQGLRFIAGQQQPNGSFISASSFSATDYRQAANFTTSFATSVISCSIAALPNSALKAAVLARAANFLASQRGPDGSWNYWQRQSAEAKTMPYPDDLDDTFYALAALRLINPAAADGAALAQAVKLLTATETRPGGPYRTWLVDKKAQAVWQDVDPAVNFTIGYFLALHQVRLPALVALAEAKIAADDYASAYYPNELVVIYLLSRFYRGPAAGQLAKQILARRVPSGHWGTPLNTALALISLDFLGLPPSRWFAPATAYLAQTARAGVWPAEGFCLDPAVNGQRRYAGSAALTTAFCLQALSLARPLPSRSPTTPRPKLVAADQRFLAEVRSAVRSTGQTLPANLRADFGQLAAKIIAFDPSIVWLSLWFSWALDLGRRQVPRARLVRLALANLYGWMAYTTYDDFYDGQGKLEKLALANLCLRRLTEIFSTDVAEPTFGPIFTKIMDGIDSANRWETSQMTASPAAPLATWPGLTVPYPTRQLSQKSLGHALAPIALTLTRTGATLADAAVVTKFFQHYLTARQLNDDAHDWEQDLLAGRLTYTLKKIFSDLGRPPGRNRTAEQLLPQLRRVFWQKTVVGLMNESLRQLDQAASLLKRHRLFIDPRPLVAILQPIRAASQKTVAEQQRMATFLRAYQSPH